MVKGIHHEFRPWLDVHLHDLTFCAMPLYLPLRKEKQPKNMPILHLVVVRFDQHPVVHQDAGSEHAACGNNNQGNQA